MPDDELDFDRDDPGDAERGPAEPRPTEPDPGFQKMIDDYLRFLDQAARGPAEPRSIDPRFQVMIDDALRWLNAAERRLSEAEQGPAKMVPVEKEYQGESGLRNFVDALAEKWAEQSAKHDEEKEPPTIWSHGERSYSTDGRMPILVSDEQDNILQCFLERDIALDTDGLTNKSGTVNVTTAISRIVEKFGEGAIRRPKKKGDGYFIRVRTLKPTR
jgi:hypothetical protein